jgi:hypothetical protein
VSFGAAAGRGGSFTLAFGGSRTSPLPWNVDSDSLALALQIALGAYAAAASPVLVVQSALRNGFQWTLTFAGRRGNVGLLRADASALLGVDPQVTVAEAVAGSSDIFPGDYTFEVQSVYVEVLGAFDAASRLSLSYEGYATGPLDFVAARNAGGRKAGARYRAHRYGAVETADRNVAARLRCVRQEKERGCEAARLREQHARHALVPGGWPFDLPLWLRPTR